MFVWFSDWVLSGFEFGLGRLFAHWQDRPQVFVHWSRATEKAPNSFSHPIINAFYSQFDSHKLGLLHFLVSPFRQTVRQMTNDVCENTAPGCLTNNVSSCEQGHVRLLTSTIRDVALSLATLFVKVGHDCCWYKVTTQTLSFEATNHFVDMLHPKQCGGGMVWLYNEIRVILTLLCRVAHFLIPHCLRYLRIHFISQTLLTFATVL